MKKSYISLFIFIVSCGHIEEPAKFISPMSERNIVHTSLMLDTLQLDSTFFSLFSELYVTDNKLIVVDRMNCYVYFYDADGKYISQKLGIGHSNKEIPSSEITGFVRDNKAQHYIFSDIEGYVFDSAFIRKGIFMTPAVFNEMSGSQLKGNDPLLYYWSQRNNVVKEYNNKIFRTVVLKEVDAFKDKDKYYNEGRSIICIEPSTGKPDFVFVRFPNIFKENNFQQFDYCSFDIDDDGSFYVSFEADSLIYEYDRHRNQVKTYGYSGRNMLTDYKYLGNSDNFHRDIAEERATKGFYQRVEYIDECNILLRLYKRGVIDEYFDGMQIYNKNMLIADIDIPKGYSLSGYIKPYIYMYKIDEVNEVMDIVRLKYSNE